MASGFAIGPDDVRAASARLRGVAVRTPLLENAALNERAGRRVLVKFEGAQHTGSFKFRGAWNRLVQIPVADRAAGVVAWSSGNHAQGVAFAARRLGIPATIVMPADAPAIKIANTRALGANIVTYDRATESREAIATAIAEAHRAVLVPSYDDPAIIAGQGTIGLEILEQAAEAGARPTRLLVCCGGGGLVAGIATAVHDADPTIAIHPVEPAAFDDTARSLASGTILANPPGAQSICDALMAPSPGMLTFPINRALLAEGLTVDDDHVRAAMRFAFTTLKLVVEPGGAVALAALLHGKIPAGSDDLALVISGANVDPISFAGILQTPS